MFACSVFLNGTLCGYTDISILVYFTILRIGFLTKQQNPYNSSYTIIPIDVYDISIIIICIVIFLSTATNPMVLLFGFLEAPSNIVMKLSFGQPISRHEFLFFAVIICHSIFDFKIAAAVLFRFFYRIIIRNRISSIEAARINIPSDYLIGGMFLGFILLFFV